MVVFCDPTRYRYSFKQELERERVGETQTNPSPNKNKKPNKQQENKSNTKGNLRCQEKGYSCRELDKILSKEDPVESYQDQVNIKQTNEHVFMRYVRLYEYLNVI